MSVKRMLATLKSLFGIGLIAPVALSAFGGFSMLAVNEGGKKDRRQAPAVEEPAAEEPAASPAPAAKGMQKTTVSAGTSITGTISSDGHVEMLGEMKGDIDAKGNVRICGQVTGNVQGNNIEMVACRVQGNVTASAILTMDGESVLVGDIGAARHDQRPRQGQRHDAGGGGLQPERHAAGRRHLRAGHHRPGRGHPRRPQGAPRQGDRKGV